MVRWLRARFLVLYLVLGLPNAWAEYHYPNNSCEPSLSNFISSAQKWCRDHCVVSAPKSKGDKESRQTIKRCVVDLDSSYNPNLCESDPSLSRGLFSCKVRPNAYKVCANLAPNPRCETSRPIAKEVLPKSPEFSKAMNEMEKRLREEIRDKWSCYVIEKADFIASCKSGAGFDAVP